MMMNQDLAVIKSTDAPIEIVRHEQTTQQAVAIWTDDAVLFTREEPWIRGTNALEVNLVTFVNNKVGDGRHALIPIYISFKKLADRTAKCAGDSSKIPECDVPRPPLDIPDIRSMDVSFRGQFLLRQTKLEPARSNRLSESNADVLLWWHAKILLVMWHPRRPNPSVITHICGMLPSCDTRRFAVLPLLRRLRETWARTGRSTRMSSF